MNNISNSWLDNYRLFSASPFIRNQEEVFDYSGYFLIIYRYAISGRFNSNPQLPSGVYKFGNWKIYCDVKKDNI